MVASVKLLPWLCCHSIDRLAGSAALTGHLIIGPLRPCQMKCYLMPTPAILPAKIMKVLGSWPAAILGNAYGWSPQVGLNRKS